jgi:2'-5' RNA ligase
MRLFIAANLDAPTRASVQAAAADLREIAERERRGSTRGVHWVEPRHLHVTLHFLGEIDDARLPSLRAVLAPPVAMDAPRLALATWGTFPSHGAARVIWLGVEAGASALAAAHAELGRRLRTIGIEPEARPFSAHLTVGRVKVPSGQFWTRLTAATPRATAAPWDLAACTLFQSRLSPAGATYQPELSIPFAAAPAARADDTREADHGE